MTITRLWQAGLETGDLSEFTGASAGGWTIGTGTPKTGTYRGASDGSHNFEFVSISASRQIRSGFFFNPASASNSGEIDIFSVKTSGGTKLLSVQMTGSVAGNNLIIDVGGVNQDSEANASAGSAYMHIGVDLKIDPSAGWVVVYKDGVEILRFEGNTGNADIVDVFFGVSGSVGVTVLYDDLYIDDTTGESAAAVVPIKRFPYTVGNGNGNYSQFTGSDSNQVDNYALVDELPPNGDTDYVEATSADLIDSYATAGYTLQPTEACVAVIPLAVCKRTGTTEQIALGTRTTTDNIGSDQNPATSYSARWERQTTKPGGGGWDQTAINALEVVIKSRGSYS